MFVSLTQRCVTIRFLQFKLVKYFPMVKARNQHLRGTLARVKKWRERERERESEMVANEEKNVSRVSGSHVCRGVTYVGSHVCDGESRVQTQCFKIT